MALDSARLLRPSAQGASISSGRPLRMQAAKFIPHTDMEKYPTVKKKLEEKGRKHM